MMNLRAIATFLTATVLVCAVAAPSPSVAESAAPASAAGDVVRAWRAAVNADAAPRRRAAHLRYEATADGLTSTVDEWIASRGRYLQEADGAFDSPATLVTSRRVERLDWTGFKRTLDGDEAERTRALAAVSAALAFGPSGDFAEAALGETEDGGAWTLTRAAPGGALCVWEVDRATGLPTAMTLSTTHGRAMELAFDYGAPEEGAADAGVRAPERVTVSAGGAVAAEYARVEPIAFERIGRRFAPLDAGASDVVMDADAIAMPFTLEANHIVVQAQVNGSAPIGFLLDTGAAYEVLNAARLDMFNVETDGGGSTTGGGGAAATRYADGVTFALPGGVELVDQKAVTLDLSGLERAWGVPIGGILGYDFLSRFVVEVDHENLELTLHRPDGWRYRGDGTSVPITLDDGLPYLDVTLSVPTKPALPAHMVLDVGASDTMIFTAPFVEANDLMRLAGVNPEVAGMPGLEKEFFAQNNRRGFIEALHLEDLTLEGIPVSFSANTRGAYADPSFAGTIGMGVYTRFHVFVDYARDRLVLEPTAKSFEPFQKRSTFGMMILASGDDLRTFTVTGVRAGSPAADAGFEAGDVIVGVDARGAADLTLGELRALFAEEGESHAVEVVRGGGAVSIPATVMLMSIDD